MINDGVWQLWQNSMVSDEWVCAGVCVYSYFWRELSPHKSVRPRCRRVYLYAWVKPLGWHWRNTPPFYPLPLLHTNNMKLVVLDVWQPHCARFHLSTGGQHDMHEEPIQYWLNSSKNCESVQNTFMVETKWSLAGKVTILHITNSQLSLHLVAVVILLR